MAAVSLPTRLAGFVRSRPVLTMLLVALVLRLAWMVNARPEPVSDYLAYRMAAFNLLDEGFFGVDGSSAVFLPGYPLFLAVLSLVSRSTVWLSLVMVVLSTSLCWVTHRLAVAVGLARLCGGRLAGGSRATLRHLLAHPGDGAPVRAPPAGGVRGRPPSRW